MALNYQDSIIRSRQKLFFLFFYDFNFIRIVRSRAEKICIFFQLYHYSFTMWLRTVKTFDRSVPVRSQYSVAYFYHGDIIPAYSRSDLQSRHIVWSFSNFRNFFRSELFNKSENPLFLFVIIAWQISHFLLIAFLLFILLSVNRLKIL